MSEIIIYEDGLVTLDAQVENETIWLSQKQISELFGVTVPIINEHIKLGRFCLSCFYKKMGCSIVPMVRRR
ncbi:MAG: hypothetical protein K0U38_07725 [Epsilonproteobacteria bacterium]|nr:hypothetical protein [Campylobacterota bacterium]